MPKYFLQTNRGIVEISRREYIEAKVRAFMDQPMGGKYMMRWMDVDEEYLLERAAQGQLDIPKWRLPEGV